MNCIKNISITGFRVQFVDRREPKPRTPREEIYTVDNDWLSAMGLLHQDPTAYVKARYERDGYYVFSVVQLKPKRCVTLDLNQLWESAAPEEAQEA